MVAEVSEEMIPAEKAFEIVFAMKDGAFVVSRGIPVMSTQVPVVILWVKETSVAAATRISTEVFGGRR